MIEWVERIGAVRANPCADADLIRSGPRSWLMRSMTMRSLPSTSTPSPGHRRNSRRHRRHPHRDRAERHRAVRTRRLEHGPQHPPRQQRPTTSTTRALPVLLDPGLHRQLRPLQTPPHHLVAQRRTHQPCQPHTPQIHPEPELLSPSRSAVLHSGGRYAKPRSVPAPLLVGGDYQLDRSSVQRGDCWWSLALRGITQEIGREARTHVALHPRCPRVSSGSVATKA